VNIPQPLRKFTFEGTYLLFVSELKHSHPSFQVELQLSDTALKLREGGGGSRGRCKSSSTRAAGIQLAPKGFNLGS